MQQQQFAQQQNANAQESERLAKEKAEIKSKQDQLAQTEKKISLATVESDQKVAENKRKLTDIEHELQV